MQNLQYWWDRINENTWHERHYDPSIRAHSHVLTQSSGVNVTSASPHILRVTSSRQQQHYGTYRRRDLWQSALTKLTRPPSMCPRHGVSHSRKLVGSSTMSSMSFFHHLPLCQLSSTVRLSVYGD